MVGHETAAAADVPDHALAFEQRLGDGVAIDAQFFGERRMEQADRPPVPPRRRRRPSPGPPPAGRPVYRFEIERIRIRHCHMTLDSLGGLSPGQ
jgi:hypothetical protein